MANAKSPCPVPDGWPEWELISADRWRSVHSDGCGILEIQPIGGWHEVRAWNRMLEGHTVQAGHVIDAPAALRRCMLAVGLEVSDE